MVPDSHARYPIRGFALFLIVLSLLTLLPGQPTFALDNVPSTLDNLQSEFATGVFQRTAIGPDKSSLTLGINEQITDEKGFVQLAPAGILKPWSLTSPPLNLPVADAGVVAVGTRLYVIGGLKRVGAVDSYSGDVYWSDVDPKNGNISGWQTLQLPTAAMIRDSDTIFDAGSGSSFATCKAATTNARTRAGVVSLPTGANTGYIYVVGGRVSMPVSACGPDDLTTSVVHRGTVAANGSISWQEMAPVPSPSAAIDGTATRLLGVDGAATVIGQTTINGVSHTYLYVLGGESLYIRGNSGAQFFQNAEEHLSRAIQTVYYTEINSSGNFVNPDTQATTNVWKRDTNVDLADLPIGVTEKAIWEASASAASVTTGSTTTSAIFLTGGAWDLNRVHPNSYVYRALIGANGALNWQGANNQTVGNETIVMNSGRMGMASIIYNNKLYMIGGRTSANQASGTVSVPTAFLADNLDLIKIDNSSFIIGDTETPAVLASGSRYSAGAAIVRAEPQDIGNETPNSAWVFVIGGSVSGGAPTETIYRGALGGDEALNTNRTPDGWYYSNVFQTGYAVGGEVAATDSKARLLALHWAVELTRPTTNPNEDIEIQFRTKSTLTGLCTDSTFSDSDAWIGGADGVDGDGNASNSLYSKPAANGALYNSVKFANLSLTDSKITGHCLQYRAHLLQGGSNSTVTPKLLSVYIEKELAGNVDINIPGSGFSVTTTAENRINAMRMIVQNLNVESPASTLSMDTWLLANGLSKDGSFFVNLCIARSELGTALPSLSIPNPATNFTSNPTNTATCPYYASVNSSEMGKGESVDLATNTMPANLGGGPRWYSNANGQPVTDIKSAFNQLGNYRIGLVLDTINNIDEGTDGELNNRGETTDFINGQTVTFTVEGAPITDFRIMLPLVTR